MSNSLLNRYWLAFTDDTPEEVARKRFLERFGYPPQEAHRRHGLLYLGPIDGNGRGPQENHRPASLLRRVEAAARPLTPERARQLAMAFLEEQ
ncbi:MAG: hypothetical protein N2556_09945 [Anaerolineae bacterium]|nr:hypothetical protein [Anaerolineae bacterium]